MREFQDKSAIAVGALFVGFVGWSLYGAIWPVETYLFRMVHMAFIFGLAFLVYPIRQNAGRWTIWLDLLLAILGVATIAYAFIDMDQFIRRSTLPEPMDLFFGIVAILLLLEISRRIVGNTFTLVVMGFLLYMYFGNYFPDVISHKGYDLDRIVGHMYMTLEGIFGVPLSVSASFVMLFVVYGTFMDVAGAGGFWLDLSLATMGRKSASAGRGAVITSALLGGPQGSGVATTMSVTPIMWPILQKAGYSPNMAAGLIATGGIGAVLSPPLMGAAAFLIMQFLGVSFWDVVVMVTVPTILYYVGTLFMVELEARKYRFAPPETEAKTVRQVMLTKGYHLLSIVVLVALLVLWNKSPEYAALGAIGDDDPDQLPEPGPERMADPPQDHRGDDRRGEEHAPGRRASRRRGPDRRDLHPDRPGAEDLLHHHVRERRFGAGRPPALADRLDAHRPEPAHHRDLHHDRGHGRAGPGQDRRPDARGAPARLLLRRAFRGLPAGRPLPLRGRGGHGRKPLRLDDAGLEVFPARLPGAVLLFDDRRRLQPPDRGGKLARFSPGHCDQPLFPVFRLPGHHRIPAQGDSPWSSGRC